MAAEICLRQIFLPQNGNLIVSCNDFLAVRIIHGAVLGPAVARITNRKMRPHLLHDQNRKLVEDPIPFGHGVRRRIGSDGKLAHG